MSLEEYGRYQTVSGTKIIMRGAMEYEEMVFYYGGELSRILGIMDKSHEERKELLKDHKVLIGLVDDMIMPSGYWHDKTGKCLMGNTGGVMGKGDELKKRLTRFDINIDEEKKSAI